MALRPGMTFPGPCVIEEASTTIVDADGSVEIDDYGRWSSLVQAMALRITELPLDVGWPRLIAIADEMADNHARRTAFSHDVVEVHDMSTGLPTTGAT